MSGSDSGPRRRVTDQRPAVRVVESPGFKLSTAVALWSLVIGMIPAIIYIGRMDATLHQQVETVNKQGLDIDALTISMTRIDTELRTVARLQAEVRNKLESPAAFRPDPHTGDDDKRAMREFERRIMKLLEERQ